MDNDSGDVDISKVFLNKDKSLYAWVSYCEVTNSINCKMSKSCVSGMCTNKSVDHSITVDHVAKAVKSLRSGKSDYHAPSWMYT